MSMDKESHQVFDVSEEEASEHFPQYLATLRQALAGHVPPRSDLPCTPAPVQLPHPPLYVVANSPASVERVARLGLNTFVNGALPLEDVAATLARFRSLAVEAGHDANALDVPVNRFVCVGRSRREAEEVMGPAFLRFMQERAPDLRAALLRLYGNEALTWGWLSQHVCIAGNAAFCAHRLQELVERGGARHILATLNLITLDHRTCVASMRRFAEEVLPSLRLSKVPVSA